MQDTRNRQIRQSSFARIASKELIIGARVRLPLNHEFKSDWPSIYVIVGLQVDCNGCLDITIAKALDHGGECSDGWSVEDLIAI